MSCKMSNGKEITDLCGSKEDRARFLRVRRHEESAKMDSEGKLIVDSDPITCEPNGRGRRELIHFLSKQGRAYLPIAVKRFDKIPRKDIEGIVRRARQRFSGNWSAHWAIGHLKVIVRCKKSECRALLQGPIPSAKPLTVKDSDWKAFKQIVMDKQDIELCARMRKTRAKVLSLSHLGRGGSTGFDFRYKTLTGADPTNEVRERARTQSKGYGAFECAERTHAYQMDYVKLKEDKIYYPCKAADGLEVYRDDLSCLLPEQYLNSTIVNFYLSEHWSLCVIDVQEEQLRIRRVNMFHLDSLNRGHKSSRVFSALKTYVESILSESLISISSKRVEVPRQPNMHDCGLFLLTNVTMILKEIRVGKVIEDQIFNESWYYIPVATTLREAILAILEGLFQDQKSWSGSSHSFTAHIHRDLAAKNLSLQDYWEALKLFVGGYFLQEKNSQRKFFASNKIGMILCDLVNSCTPKFDKELHNLFVSLLPELQSFLFTIAGCVDLSLVTLSAQFEGPGFLETSLGLILSHSFDFTQLS